MSDTKIQAAIDCSWTYGGIDGAHHKQWLIDQMLRSLLDDQYDSWVKAYNEDVDEEGGSYSLWDVGIAP